MHKFLKLFFLLSSFLILKAQANSVYKGGAELLNKKAYSVYLDASVYLMTGNLDYEGTEVPVAENYSYRMIDSDLKVSYGLNSNIETSVFLKIRNVASENAVTASTNAGIESIGFEGKYGFKSSNLLRYAVGLHYRKSLYTNTFYPTGTIPDDAKVILGDDGAEYGLDMYATYSDNPWKYDFKLGYNAPSKLSAEIVYNLQALYKFSVLSFFAGAKGIRSLKTDQYTDTPSLKPSNINVGSTYQFNSLNREKNALYIGSYYAYDKYLLGLKIESILSGKSTDKANIILLSAAWNTDGVTSESVKINSFKEYHIDGSVLKVSAKGNFVKIDQGLSTDVEKGARFDIYQTDYFGGNVLVATGVIFQIGADWSVIKVTKKYKDIEIKPGFSARGF